ncbi:MAG: HAD family phosphatase [Spirochaetia bacterium]|nr:HAD family phosphatase [Spirochaetia bacterium]MBP5739299.1 HAD family phosphatase [Spirochaetia bacterium]
MELKGVIFDMDGVIVNSEALHVKFECDILKSLGIDFPKEGFPEYAGLAMDKFWLSLKERYGLKQPVEELLAYDTEMRAKAFREHDHFDAPAGVSGLIKSLKRAGVPLALASSSHTMVIDAILDKLGFRRYFDVVVSGFELENGKPAPDIFLYAADLLGTPNAETLVIEDTANGVLAAKNAGMKCFGYQNTTNPTRQDLSMADFISDDFSSVTLDQLRKVMEG